MIIDETAPAMHPVLVLISDLKLDPKNAMTHGPRNLRSIASSLTDFKQRKPIVVNSRTMTVEAGNGTVEAALDAGATHIVAVLCDDDDATAAAFAIVDNLTAKLAEWDDDQLADTMLELPEVDWDGYGFELDDLVDLGVATTPLGVASPLGDRPRPSGCRPELDEHDDDDDDADYESLGGGSDHDKSGATTPMIRWGKTRVPMTANELRVLEAAYKAHFDRMGGPFGFIAKILGD